MVDLNPNIYTCDPSTWGNKTDNPIVLQCCNNHKFTIPQSYNIDKFEKNKDDNSPIEIDPNDKFVLGEYNNDNIESLVCPQCNQKLSASFNPKKASEIGKDCWKWGRRIWTGLEVYDTIDGYKERMANNTPEA